MEIHERQVAYKLDIREVRVQRLRELLGDTRLAEFCRQHPPIDPGYLSQLLNGHRGFGEKAARNLERQAGWAPMSLDRTDAADPAGEPAADHEPEKVFVSRIVGAKLSAGNGEVFYDYDQIDRSHSFRLDWMQHHGMKAENCKLWEASGESMWPTIENGELVLIHMRERDPIHAKVFALITEDGLRLKRLMRRSDGVWEIHSDNANKHLYPTETFVPGDVAIMGRVRWHAGEM